MNQKIKDLNDEIKGHKIRIALLVNRAANEVLKQLK
jgi:hypothetical protein